MWLKYILHKIPLIHFYGKWKTIRRVDGILAGNIYAYQERDCQLCGKVENRTAAPQFWT